jgi:hypothetical protein
MKKTIGANLTMNEIDYIDEIGQYEFHHMNEIANIDDINDMDTIGAKE